MVSPVLVTGGTGRLGKLVVARLLDSGCDVRVLARHHRPVPPGVTFFTADLPTGRDVEPAVTAAAAIIHCATSTRGDAEATRNLVAVLHTWCTCPSSASTRSPPGDTRRRSSGPRK
jgi:nucleoside-diphosphate-sugar epimerase